jgi:putative transposase
MVSLLRRLAVTKPGGWARPGSAAKVVLTERQQEVLLQLSRASTTALAVAVRAEVILLAFEGLDNQARADRLGLGRHQVGLWRRRWQRGFDRLAALECLEGRAALRRALEKALRDQPRPGCPGPFPAEPLTLLVGPGRGAGPPRCWAGVADSPDTPNRSVLSAS